MTNKQIAARTSTQGQATERQTPASSRQVSSGEKPYRVVVADDHTVVRKGVRALLEMQPGIEIAAEAVNGLEALHLVRQLKPDLLVLDLTMPEMNGLELAQAIREENMTTDLLVLTMHFSEEVAREALRCGAMAYVLKSDADTDLLAAVDHVRHHQPFFTGQLAVSMAENFVNLNPQQKSAPPEQTASPMPGIPLTQRELDVIKLLAQGKSNKEAAHNLRVSARTVESHRSHIMRKMNFASFSDLIRFAVRNHIVEL
jgi:DNA-binding NarL/FixJ family response regulator